MAFQKIKGTQDFFGEKAMQMNYIHETLENITRRYGFTPVQTPIFEATEVFQRGVGEGTDVVTKEMYTFLDKGERSITLRPEGTAAVVRSFVENKFYAQPGLKKYSYFGPMFRYERPQTGRFRQFHQFGVEVFGDITPYCDCDVIASAYYGFQALGIKDIVLKINTIGDFASREQYSKVLRDYFGAHIDNLCEDCKKRLEKNPLRILDCKVDAESPILKDAPLITDSLSDEAKVYFKHVLEGLDALHIPYSVDEGLVRGLDYYTGCVFEFQSTHDDELKGLALGGGGKYAGLVKELGGPDVSGLGYALGIERLMTALSLQNLYPQLKDDVTIVLASLDEEAKLKTLELAQKLRQAHLSVELDYNENKLKQQFKLAERVNAHYIGIIGSDELANNTINIKDLASGQQEEVSLDQLTSYLKERK